MFVGGGQELEGDWTSVYHIKVDQSDLSLLVEQALGFLLV